MWSELTVGIDTSAYLTLDITATSSKRDVEPVTKALNLLHPIIKRMVGFVNLKIVSCQGSSSITGQHK